MSGKAKLSFAVCIFFICAFSSSHAALVLNPAMPITSLVRVQPIIVSNDDGSNTATYFGNATQQATIFGLVDDIWAQAGIDVDFLSPNFWNDTFANIGNMDQRPQSDLGTIRADGIAAGVANADATILNMYLVNSVPGFNINDLIPNNAAGLASVGGNGFAQWVGSSLLTFQDGLEVIASVVAHEIGHNLGLDHNAIDENLMAQGAADGERLNAAQIADVLNNSQFVTAAPVPVPAAVWLFASALIGLFSVRNRKTGNSLAEPALA